MTTSITVSFFKVSTSLDEVPFHSLLRQTHALPRNQERTRDVVDQPMRLQESHDGTVFEGELMRIRMHGIPPGVTLAGAQRRLPLKVDEGLGEGTAFLYDSSVKVIAIQKNRFGVTPNALARYFELGADRDLVVTLDPLIQPAALQRLASMETIRSLHLRVASVSGQLPLMSKSNSVSRAIECLMDFEAPTMEVRITMGHARGTANKPKVLETVRSFLRMAEKSPGSVTAIRISGRTSDEEIAVLDMLEDRMQETVIIGDDRPRESRYSELRQAISDAYARRMDEIKKTYAEEA